MKTMTPQRMASGALCLAVLGLAACASPASRIRRQPEVFASFPPEAQAAVREGRIALGFSPEMVRMALGKPYRVYVRKTEQGEAEIWSYVTWESRGRVGLGFSSGYYVRDARGRRWWTPDWVDSSYNDWYDREYLRVEFQESRVTSIEQIKSPR